MRDRDRLFTIGELAKRTGLTVRTIRFWSDEGIVPPTGRTGTGYRLYDTEAVARLDLVKTLRELGVNLSTVRAVLREQVTVADVAAAHVEALSEEIRMLRTQRAVLASVAQRDSTSEEMRIMHELAKLSAAQRKQLIDDFVAEIFEGTDPDAPGAGIANGMRQLPTELPDEPSTEQVDAWVELAELVQDDDFKATCRKMAVAGSDSGPQVENPIDHQRLVEVVTREVIDSVEPGTEAAGRILSDVGAGELTGQQKRDVADVIETFSDRRVERYWHLLGVLNGWPPMPGAKSSTASFEWLIAALRADA